MGKLYYLAFRDIASSSTGVTSGELYALDQAGPALTWPQARLTGADWVPWAQVPDVFRNQRVCFVIHGFNTNVDHGVKAGGPMSQEYEGLGPLGLAMSGADIVVTVLWPGDGLIGWSWFTALAHTKTVGARFADFLTSSAFTGSEVSFISHSLGARVVLETVAQTSRRTSRIRFDTAVLTAAAVDDTALDDERLAAGSAALRRIVILSSVADGVLKVFFTAGAAVESALWNDYDTDLRALGRYGPAFKADSASPAKTEWYDILSSEGQDHGDYLPMGWAPPPPPPPNGWSSKRQKVARFCCDVFDSTPFLPGLANWATDKTARFRPGWTPKL
jgi:hypothetical protein